MVENKSTILGIIALIIGATGLGLGAFSFISLQAVEGEQGLPGEDGQDGIHGIDGINAPGYYCDSAAEVQQALDSIGTGSGKIILTESITLNSKINISGGGSYVIQGQGGSTIINCSNWNAFDITNATSCIIKDLKIDSSDIGYSTAIININETNDNPVYIEKIQVIGDSDRYGYGTRIGSGNVWIINCFISEVNTGIYQTSNLGIAHIYDNTIRDYLIDGMHIEGDNNHISGNSIEIGINYGMRIYGSHNMVTDNLIRDSQFGIIIFGDSNTIKDNNMYSIQANGIYSLDCDYNEISGNSILVGGSVGIYLDNCNYSVILGNLISDFGAYGIFLDNCTSNVISGNQISFGNHHGIYLYYNSDYNVISGNSIINLSRTDSVSFAGIQLSIDADFNTISSNGIFNCVSYGGGTGYGIRIWEYLGFLCNNNTVLGNTALNNNINWDDSGTNTFGNSTNNNFG